MNKEDKKKLFFRLVILGCILSCIGWIYTSFQAMPVFIFLGYVFAIAIIFFIGFIGIVCIDRKESKKVIKR